MRLATRWIAVLALTFVAACGGDDDDNAVDASMIDAVATSDASDIDAPTTVDAADVDAAETDAAETDAAEMDAAEPDAAQTGVDASEPDASPVVDAGLFDIPTICNHVCTHIGVCFQVDPTGCEDGCVPDLADCTDQQLVDVEACASVDCSNDPNAPLACLQQVSCVEGV